MHLFYSVAMYAKRAPVSIVCNRMESQNEGPCPPEKTILHATRKFSTKVLFQYDSFKGSLIAGPFLQEMEVLVPSWSHIYNFTVLSKRKEDLKLVLSTNVLK